jgi:hypothetical protein
MKWVCNNDESNELCALIKKFDRHRSEYTKVNHIEFAKQTISKRMVVGDPMIQVLANCVKINGLGSNDVEGDTTWYGKQWFEKMNATEDASAIEEFIHDRTYVKTFPVDKVVPKQTKNLLI